MKKKFTYLITIEKNAYMCIAEKHTDFYILDYSLDTEKNIRKFLKLINPRNYYPHLVILFIRELKGRGWKQI